MLRDVANTGVKLIQNTFGSGHKAQPSAVLCAEPCPTSSSDTRSPPHQHKSRRTPAGRRSRPRRQRGPSKLCIKEGPCIHHGPHSFHATSECRDPTLSKSKKTQPRPPANGPKLAGIATTSQATLAPDHLSDSTARNHRTSDVMYSPVFLTQISSSAKLNARTQFLPHLRHETNLRRGRHQQRSTRAHYDARTISLDALNNCVRTYTRPIHGKTIPDMRGVHMQRHTTYHRVKKSTSKWRRKQNLRRRRRVRNWRNRNIQYPDGVFVPSRQRQPRRFSPGPIADAAANSNVLNIKLALCPHPTTNRATSHYHSASLLLVSSSSCGYSFELP